MSIQNVASLHQAISFYLIYNSYHCSSNYLLIETKDCEHKTEKKELRTTHCGHEDIASATRIEQTSVRDKPNLRQLFGAQSPILSQWQLHRRLRTSSAVEFGHKGGSSGSTLLGTIAEAQECQVPSPESQEEDNSDLLSTNDRSWKEVVATMEQLHEVELMDLREDMEALESKHQEEILAANSKKLVLQKRVKKLLQQKSEDNALREENIRLSNLVASLVSRNEELNAVLQSTQDQNEQLECQLLESEDKNRLVAGNLQRAIQEAEVYRYRAYQLEYALEQQLGKYADVDREIQLRDQRYSDLELRAMDCLTAMTELEKKCFEGHEAACAEATDLKARLGKQDVEIELLKASKATFQHQSEEVFAMLAGRVLPSNLFDAMNEYYQLVIQDNGILTKKIEDQMVEISSHRNTAKLLCYDNRCLKTQQLLDQKIQSELEDKIRAQDVELGRLEFEIGCVTAEHLQDIEVKDSVITNLKATIDNHSREADSLARATDVGDIRQLVQTKNRQIVGLNVELNNLRGENRALEQYKRAQIENEQFTAVAVYFSERESEQLKMRLAVADEEIWGLRRRLQEWRLQDLEA